MAVASIINVILGLNSSTFDRDIKKLEKKLGRLSQQFDKVGKDLSMFVTVPLVAAGAAAFKFASDYEESMNKVNVAFGNSSDEVRKFAQTTLNSFGIAEGSALDMAALFGDMSTSMGISQKEAANLSISLVGLAGDLASFKNMNISEVTTALNGVFTGETESLKRLGVVMTQANLEQYALQIGSQKLFSEMTQGEKVMLRYQYVMSMTSNAHGDFERTGGGAANQMRVFQEGLKELSVSFGQVILPTITKIITKMNQFISSFRDLDDSVKRNIVIYGILAAAIGPVLIVIGKVILALKTIIPLFTLANLQILAVTGAIIGLAVGATYLVMNWEALQERFMNFFRLIDNWFIGTIVSLLKYLQKLAAFLGLDILDETIDRVSGLADEVPKATKELKGLGEIFTSVKKSVDVFGLSADAASDKTSELSSGLTNTANSADNFSGAVVKSKEEIEAAREASDKWIDSLKDVLITMQNFTGSYRFLTDMKDKIQEAKDEYIKLAETHKDIIAELRKPADVNVNVLGTDKALADVESFSDGVTNSLNQAVTASIAGTAAIVGEMVAMGASFDNIAMSVGRFLLETLANLMIDVGTAAIATGAAIEGIKEALTSLNPVIAIAAGLALIGLGAGIKGYLSNTAEKYSGTTAFADGGIVSGPTRALVGEYPGAKSNPEIIAPLSKLESILSRSLGNMGFMPQNTSFGNMAQLQPIPTGGNQRLTMTVQVEGVIKGRDIYFANKRFESDKIRTT
jgi:hypothetical protein